MKSIIGVLKDAVVGVDSFIRGTISAGLAGVARGARGLSGTVQENVGPSLSKASEELPKVVQAAPGAIGAAAGGAKKAVASHWEWIKKGVEGRWK